MLYGRGRRRGVGWVAYPSNCPVVLLRLEEYVCQAVAFDWRAILNGLDNERIGWLVRRAVAGIGSTSICNWNWLRGNS